MSIVIVTIANNVDVIAMLQSQFKLILCTAGISGKFIAYNSSLSAVIIKKESSKRNK